MYDESIRRALRRTKLKPLTLPAQCIDALLENFRATMPDSVILTGTAGDGKTYHCRAVWLALGGSDQDWDEGNKVQSLFIGDRKLVIVKDLSELGELESDELIRQLGTDIVDPQRMTLYLIAANHGQLLERLKAVADSKQVDGLTNAVEALMVTGRAPPQGTHIQLFDLSRWPAADHLMHVIREIVTHDGWDGCQDCGAAGQCPILINRERLLEDESGERLKLRLQNLVRISELNGHHFPIRQLLVLVTNMILGHPEARHGLMTCPEAVQLAHQGRSDGASLYRNVFGENLKPSVAERTDPFAKLALFGVGQETSNAVDSLLVYGADDPHLQVRYDSLMRADVHYGATTAFARAQLDYLEGAESSAQATFLNLLRGQRQRLFFTLPDSDPITGSVWDLTIFKHAGEYLAAAEAQTRPPARETLTRIVRGLNRVFSGMLIQTADQLVLATSGTHSETKISSLVEEFLSVPRKSGEEVAIVAGNDAQIDLKVSFARDDDPPPVTLTLTPTRFEFLCRVADGALPTSFSLECFEDFLALKARLLSAAKCRQALDGPAHGDAFELCFLDVTDDGRANSRRVSVRL
ncbi:hypothetical protein GCM10009093_12150 [Brevundimonas terrae]|uniref:Uncharacterized protein n=2 Tax=Brevundimonas terrae TaxID=363631 RepID=A0ABP3I0Q0_9CAUL